MRIAGVESYDDGTLKIIADDGRVGIFDVKPYMESEAFRTLKDPAAFAAVINGGYFIEWKCGADLSADTIEARWEQVESIKAVAEDGAAYGNGEG